MPTYEYCCKECQHNFEAFQTISEPPVDKCPKCGGKVKRIISGGAGFIFKGSGFYITDHRSAEYKAAALKEQSKKPEGKDTSAAKSSASEKSKISPKSAPGASKDPAAKTT